MRSARFVTLCFVYSGLVLLAQYVVVSQFRLDVTALGQLGVALSILAGGLVGVRYPEEGTQNPAEWGLFTYGMAALSVALTVIFLAQLVSL
ncbi:hypothetical protein [Halorhabdus amylolytica]|uniref:hypothetical protein n=1 Tax=Halorhabdus amylolytica TaxID=2559573 RepID=UPI0010A9CE1B|nr:hypothetical protein [Halorhabdus amylolytica]